MVPILVTRFKLALPLGTVVESIVGPNTELEVAIATIPATDTQYKFSPCSELNMVQPQIIIVCLASLWK